MPYYRGDYYRGDYYRGDFWGSLAKGVKSVAGIAAKVFLPGVAGTVVGAVMNKGGGTPPIAQQQPSLPGIGLPGPYRIDPIHALPGGKPLTFRDANETGALPRGYHWNKSTYYTLDGRLHYKGTTPVRNRSMNVCNVRALRRGMRRAEGFAKVAKRVMSFTKTHHIRKG